MKLSVPKMYIDIKNCTCSCKNICNPLSCNNYVRIKVKVNTKEEV